jgi:hypothetical protein
VVLVQVDLLVLIIMVEVVEQVDFYQGLLPKPLGPVTTSASEGAAVVVLTKEPMDQIQYLIHTLL